MSLMGWVTGRLVGERPDWWPAPAIMDDRPLLSDRWVIIDSESTGLSPARDRLLSVAAVTLASASLPVAGQWYATLSPPTESAGELAQDMGDSVLIHRLTPGLIAGGMTLREAIETMCRFVGDAPVLAFHHGHDRAFLNRAARQTGFVHLPWHWWEVSDVLALAWPDIEPMPQGLDAWLAAQGVPVMERHHAQEDAWATALLLLKALPRLVARGIDTRAKLQAAVLELRGLRRWRV